MRYDIKLDRQGEANGGGRIKGEMNNRPARGGHAQSYPPDLLHRIETAHIRKQ